MFDGFERNDDKNKTLKKRREVRHKLFEKIEQMEAEIDNNDKEMVKALEKLKKTDKTSKC